MPEKGVQCQSLIVAVKFAGCVVVAGSTPSGLKLLK
jgi:hypothetical protein